MERQQQVAAAGLHITDNGRHFWRDGPHGRRTIPISIYGTAGGEDGRQSAVQQTTLNASGSFLGEIVRIILFGLKMKRNNDNSVRMRMC